MWRPKSTKTKRCYLVAKWTNIVKLSSVMEPIKLSPIKLKFKMKQDRTPFSTKHLQILYRVTQISQYKYSMKIFWQTLSLVKWWYRPKTLSAKIQTGKWMPNLSTWLEMTVNRQALSPSKLRLLISTMMKKFYDTLYLIFRVSLK